MNDEGYPETVVNFQPIVEAKGERSVMSVMSLRGLPGPAGPIFNPPFFCYHRDRFLFDESPINLPILRWQIEECGSPGHPWSGNVVIVRGRDQRGGYYVDVKEEDIPELRRFFARCARK
ncbi:hypothetical protein FRB96_009005 [Tulasnella sp. 330]|nr:hypothetical protein FRB96_009005 [Tulasnella sp. 330]